MATKDDLTKQFNLRITSAMKKAFQDAGDNHGFDPALLMSIASRETNFIPRYLTSPGDNGHGHGLMQIDDRSYPEFCATDAWKDPAQNIRKGAEVLAEKRRTVDHILAQRTNSLSPSTPGNMLLRCYVAAYNCGAQAAINGFLINHNVDAHTTDHDYSADVVLIRYPIFQSLLKGA